jgi:hypothetical protein
MLKGKIGGGNVRVAVMLFRLLRGLDWNGTPQILDAGIVLACVAFDLVVHNLALGIFACNHQRDLQRDCIHSASNAIRESVIDQEAAFLVVLEFADCLLEEGKRLASMTFAHSKLTSMLIARTSKSD